MISSVDCCLPKMSPSSSTSTGSQIATWRRSLAWTRHDSTPISDYRRRERCSSDHRRFLLNPARHDILPHRQSQLSDLTIRLHITTSLKSISQKRWVITLYSNGQQSPNKVTWPLKIRYSNNHKYVIFRHQLTDLSKTNRRSPAATVLQRKASMHQIGIPISASN